MVAGVGKVVVMLAIEPWGAELVVKTMEGTLMAQVVDGTGLAEASVKAQASKTVPL